jgi:hypothetical protein
LRTSQEILFINKNKNELQNFLRSKAFRMICFSRGFQKETLQIYKSLRESGRLTGSQYNLPLFRKWIGQERKYFLLNYTPSRSFLFRCKLNNLSLLKRKPTKQKETREIHSKTHIAQCTQSKSKQLFCEKVWSTSHILYICTV